MKRLLLMIFLLSSVCVCAQYTDGEPYNFCTLSNVVYNPGEHGYADDNLIESNMWVVTIDDGDYTKSERTLLQMRFNDDYSNHTIIEDATPTYNCHGYSFGIYQGTIPCRIKWYDEFCNEAFELIADTNNLQYGDIAVVRYRISQNSPIYDPGSIHSSIVVNQDTLISKWGIGPLTKHHKYDLVNVGGFENGTSVYTYYRRVVNTQINGPEVFNGSGTYTFVPNVTPAECSWKVEPAVMFQQSSGNGYVANLSYKTNLSHIYPKAVVTFTFKYGCDNTYTVKKEIDLAIPTSTLSGIRTSDGFTVDNGATVTLTGEVRMSENSKVVIRPGGRLIINGGILTNACPDKKWRGIEVWGDDDKHQNLVNGQYQQGYLELRNGATIENAVCAVELWKPDDYSSEGGIIEASDAVFRNNAKAVHALNYTNYSPVTGRRELRHAGSYQYAGHRCHES